MDLYSYACDLCGKRSEPTEDADLPKGWRQLSNYDAENDISVSMDVCGTCIKTAPVQLLVGNLDKQWRKEKKEQEKA